MSVTDKDIFGEALLDYLRGRARGDITTYLSLPGFMESIRDTFSLSYLFRGKDEMPGLEQRALSLCRGKVLDIGCGAGSHAICLQGNGLDVTGLDQSAGAVQTSCARGLKKVIHSPVMEYHGTNFDTLLLLMNGIGMAGRFHELAPFLDRLKSLLAEKGQILVDSSDIRYLYQDDEDCAFYIPQDPPYYGEGRFVMEYQGKKSGEFPWLYLDYECLEQAAAGRGLNCRLVARGPHYEYLALLENMY